MESLSQNFDSAENNNDISDVKIIEDYKNHEEGSKSQDDDLLQIPAFLRRQAN